MRQLLFTLLLTGLLLPAPIMAATTDITDPNNPAFAAMKKEAAERDKAGVTINGKTTETNFLAQLSAGPEATRLRARGCNPVVKALQHQVGNGKTMREAALKSAVYTVDTKNDVCADLINRTQYVSAMRAKVAEINQAITTAASAAVGPTAAPLIMQFANQFNLQPSDIITGEMDKLIEGQCMTLDNNRNALFANMGRGFGQFAMQAATDRDLFTVKFDSSSMNRRSPNTPANTNKSAIALPAAKPKPAAAPTAAAPVPAQQKPAPAASTTPPAPARNIYQ